MEHIWVIIGLFFKLVCKFRNFRNKMLEVGGGVGGIRQWIQSWARNSASCRGPPGTVWPGHQRTRSESLLEMILPALAQAGEGRRARGWGPAAALHPPPPPILERSAFQASRRALSLGRLEQGAFCEVQCSLAGR